MKKSKEIECKFADFVERNSWLHKNDPVLLAVSGGIDSVVMCHLFSKSRFKIAFAHCNFKLRNEASDQDEEFVKDLAARYKVPFFSKSFDTKDYAGERKISTQMAARELRYQWFEQLRKEKGFKYVATAHHKNDTIETVLLNLAKGTGIAGLHGIPHKTHQIIRPLLAIFKEDILTYAQEENLDYREDHTNAESEYQRNKIRNNIIPLLQEINPGFINTFTGNIEKFADAEAIYKKGISYYHKKLLDKRGEEYYIPIKKLVLIEGYKTVLYEILSEFEFNEKQVEQIISALPGQSGKQFFSDNFRIVKDRDFLIITKKDTEESGFIVVEHIKKNTRLKDFSLHYHLKKAAAVHPKKDPVYAYLDYGQLTFPLIIRKWKRGDYFYPFGVGKRKDPSKPGKKKISDFLTDIKLSLVEKEKVWVLESEQKIAWVIGYRIDHRFSITGNTREVLQIKKR